MLLVLFVLRVTLYMSLLEIAFSVTGKMIDSPS